MHLKELYLSDRLSWLRQVIKFGIVGVTNIILDVGIYYSLTRFLGIYYILAATISFVIVTTWSFNLNRRWTFNGQKVSKRLRTQYAQFFSVNILVLILNASAMYVLVDIFIINDLIAKIFAGVIIGLINFSINKFWTFRDIGKLEQKLLNK